MPHYRCVGEVPRKRHSKTTLHEELMGTGGFSGPSSLLYHRHPPSALLATEFADVEPPQLVPIRPLRPLHLRPSETPRGSRRVLVANDHVAITWTELEHTTFLVRFVTGDQLAYVHSGRGVLESTFGRLAAGPGDYVVIPAGTTYRWRVEDAPLQLFGVDARRRIEIPERYLTSTGQLKEGAPFSERDIRAPEEPFVAEDGLAEVFVYTGDGTHRVTSLHHPLDVVGWDGCVYPWALNIGDFEPIVGRFHQPPPVHQTFAGDRFVVCSFVPRLYDTDPDAVKVPYHHANLDSDEVLFYAGGDFMSRKGSGIDRGSVTVHPSGFVHGPHPGSREASEDKVRTDELAVMVDTFDPLRLAADGIGCEDTMYWRSWAGTAPDAARD